jgi:hypothetical protein
VNAKLLRLRAIVFETASVRTVDLRDGEDRALPAFTPGAPVDVRPTVRLVRGYSVVGDETGRGPYLDL